MIKAFAVLNMVIGTLGLFAGLALTFLGWSLSGGGASAAFEAFVYCAPLAVAGYLYGVSGLILWRSSNNVPGKQLLIQGLAIVFAILYCVAMFTAIPKEQRSVQDEEVLMFVFVPAGLLLLAVIELVILCVTWSRDRSITTG
jgi:hypothetical protein